MVLGMGMKQGRRAAVWLSCSHRLAQRLMQVWVSYLGCRDALGPKGPGCVLLIWRRAVPAYKASICSSLHGHTLDTP